MMADARRGGRGARGGSRGRYRRAGWASASPADRTAAPSVPQCGDLLGPFRTAVRRARRINTHHPEEHASTDQEQEALLARPSSKCLDVSSLADRVWILPSSSEGGGHRWLRRLPSAAAREEVYDRKHLAHLQERILELRRQRLEPVRGRSRSAASPSVRRGLAGPPPRRRRRELRCPEALRVVIEAAFAAIADIAPAFAENTRAVTERIAEKSSRGIVDLSRVLC